MSTGCLVLLLGGTALAIGNAGPSAASKLYVCAKRSGPSKGALRLVSSRSRCRRSERKVSWAKTAAQPATGAVGFYARSACPAGWSPYEAARGRYLVGLPAGGQLAAEVGSALSPQENRAVGRHDHGVMDPGHAHTADVQQTLSGGNVTAQKFQGNAEGGTADQTLSTAASATGVSVNPAGAVEGTNAPYLQLLACKKD